jgi:site-specific DNA recombinase
MAAQRQTLECRPQGRAQGQEGANDVSTLRAVIYARVSTEDQAENGTSLETQELACLRRAAELGARVVATYRDEGVSGTLYAGRPEVQKALGAIEAREASMLIVNSISRLSRDVEHQQTMRKRIERAGGQLVICDMPIGDTEEGDLMFGVSGAFAQYEAKLIRKRTMTGSRRVAETGKQPARGQRPYGYRIVTRADVLRGAHPEGSEGTYVVLDSEAEVVRRIFVQYVAAGSLRGVAETLNTDHVPTPRGCAYWQPRTVEYILTNPVYRGQATYGLRQSHKDERRQTEHGFKTASFQRPREEGPLFSIAAPAIVDEGSWLAATAKLRAAKSAIGGNPKRSYLLSGVARCPVCGRGLAGRSSAGHRHYVCNRVERAAHRKTAYEAGKLERLTLDALVAALDTPESLAAAAEAYRRMACEPQPEVDTDAIRRRLAELEERAKCTARAQVEAMMNGRDTAVYDELLNEIDRERASASRRLAEASPDRAGAQATPDPSSAREALQALRRVLTAEDTLSVVERRAAIAGFVRELRPNGEGVRLQLAAGASTSKLCASGWLCTQFSRSSLQQSLPHVWELTYSATQGLQVMVRDAASAEVACGSAPL